MATCHALLGRDTPSYRPLASRVALNGDVQCESGLVELPQQQRTDDVGLGAALRALHHLADQELYRGGLARAIVLDRLRILRDHLLDDAVPARPVARSATMPSRATIAPGASPAGKGLLQHIFRLLAADVSRVDQIKQLGQPSRRYRGSRRSPARRR